MVVGLVPITGIPLPFLSYGGTFTLMIFVATGLILGVDLRRYVNR
jgi:rod shape determining protein RodA